MNLGYSMPPKIITLIIMESLCSQIILESISSNFNKINLEVIMLTL